MTETRPCRIGCGAGFSSDRLPPAVALVEEGELDVLILECIGERTLAFGHRDRKKDPNKGYNAYLQHRMKALLGPCRKRGTKIVTNMGVANPLEAARQTQRIARELDLHDIRIAAVLGDEITWLLGASSELWEGGTVGDQPGEMIGANAYLGIDAMLGAMDADVVITGRVADPSLTLAPLVHHFGWHTDDWVKLGAGTLAGHLIECGMQITGGYFADPGYKDVPNLADCGYPIAEVTRDGAVTISKLESAGGLVSVATVKEQLLYEVHDPSAYLTPDVTADFSTVSINEISPNRVKIEGANGYVRPQCLKATVGFDGGYLAEAGVSYAGPGAERRARLARSVLEERLHGLNEKVRLDLIGVDALHATAHQSSSLTEDQSTASNPSRDVRLRAAVRTFDPAIAEQLLWETEALLCCGPAGGGGFRRSITPSVVTASTSIDRQAVETRIEWFEA